MTHEQMPRESKKYSSNIPRGVLRHRDTAAHERAHVAEKHYLKSLTSQVLHWTSCQQTVLPEWTGLSCGSSHLWMPLENAGNGGSGTQVPHPAKASLTVITRQEPQAGLELEDSVHIGGGEVLASLVAFGAAS